MSLLVPRPDPPLVPSPDEARGLLRRELARDEYRQDLLPRILARLQRLFEDALAAAAGVGPASAVAALLVLLGLALALMWLLSRARTTAAATPPGALLGAEEVSAAELRRRAQEALLEGRHEDAVVDAVRALTVHQVELGRLTDVPGATAREVAAALAAGAPPLAARFDRMAALFDGVLYGKHPASAGDARFVLTLDDELAGVR